VPHRRRVSVLAVGDLSLPNPCTGECPTKSWTCSLVVNYPEHWLNCPLWGYISPSPMVIPPIGTRWLLSACCLLCACGGSPVAVRPASSLAAALEFEPFTVSERNLLESGRAVNRERALTRNDQDYLGTVSYQLVSARSSTVMGAFSHDSWSALLPKTKRATLLESRGGVSRVELAQGNDWITAEYTVYVKRESSTELRFWLDRTRPHDVDDAWGYFRAEPYDDQRTLVTVAVAVDIGSGLLTGLFRSAVQASILTTPALIKRHVERLEVERGS
jgi:hypothetical protein